MNPRMFRTVLASSAVVCTLGYMATAGPLNPPVGPIAATYKTLGDVEPRIAINASNTPATASALFSISQPGSYYLTGDVTGVSSKRGIEVLVPNVTIDLNGFTLSGTSGPAAGIYINASASRVNIRNGTIVGWGFDGIDGGFNTNGSFEHITAMNNGAASSGRFGIRAGNNMHVRDCIANSNTGGGISVNDNCDVIDCIAVTNSANGFTAGAANVLRGCTTRGNIASGFVLTDSNTVENCAAANNGNYGFSAGANATFTACSANSNSSDNFSTGARGSLVNCSAHASPGGNGIILLGPGGSATGCNADANAYRGIYVQVSGSVTNCTCSNNSLVGVFVGAHSRVANCLISGNIGTGILVDTGGDTEIIDNTCSLNGLGTSGSGIYISAIAPNCRIEHNMLSTNYQNLTVASTGNLIVRNSLSAPGNGGNYSLTTPQAYGPFVNVNSVNSMSSIVGSEHPQANFIR